MFTLIIRLVSCYMTCVVGGGLMSEVCGPKNYCQYGHTDNSGCPL